MNRIATCKLCLQAVHIVAGEDGKRVAVDPEIIAVIPAAGGGGALSTAPVITGRRVHAELCSTYAARREKDRLKREQRVYRRKEGL